MRGSDDSAACVQIAIETREVAAGDFEPDPVPALEQIAGRDQIDC
jgi:hypothetical protein